jgi:hypothetical protein
MVQLNTYYSIFRHTSLHFLHTAINNTATSSQQGQGQVHVLPSIQSNGEREEFPKSSAPPPRPSPVDSVTQQAIDKLLYYIDKFGRYTWTTSFQTRFTSNRGSSYQ